MGGICSRKRDQPVDEDGVRRVQSGKYCKSGSSKWLGTSFSRPVTDCQTGGSFSSLMELCIYKICQDIDKYETFSMLPRDISQQIFNELVYSHRLTDISIEAFRDCALQVNVLGPCLDFLIAYSRIRMNKFKAGNENQGRAHLFQHY